MNDSNARKTAVVTELNTQHAALVAELEALETQIPQLKNTWRSFPPNYNHLGHKIGSPAESAAMEALGDAEGRARAIRQELEKIKQQVAHLERVSAIETVKGESKQIITDTAITLEALERKQSRLNESIDALQKESEQASAKARQAQQNAADLYATSVSSGDSAAARVALAEVQKTSKLLVAADDQSEQQNRLITALQGELAVVETQIATAQQEQENARSALLGALELGVDEEWNVLAERLAVLGARKSTLNHARDGHGDGLRNLKIPRFGPASQVLDRDYVIDLASKISVTDLLAE